jgi:surface carbohydrate biosynthesis protein
MFNLFKRKKYVYFHIDELNRDSVVASALKKELAEKGVKLIYGCRLYSNYLIKYFAKYFDAVVFPKPYFLRYFDKNCFNETKVIILYTENIGIVVDSGVDKMVLKGALDEDFMSGDSVYVDMVDAFCFWGSLVRDTVVKHHPYLENKCHVVGHPRHSLHSLPLIKNFDSLSKTKHLGIITRHTYLNDYMGRNTLEKLAQYLKNTVKYEYYNHTTQDYLISERRGSLPENEAFTEAVDAKNIFLIIKDALNKKYTVSIKTHPRENHETWKMLFKSYGMSIKFVDASIPLTHWLVGLDYLLGPPSSCFYDAVLIGVTPISIHNLDNRRQQFILSMAEDNNKLMPHVYAPKSIEDINKFIGSNKKTKITKEIKKILSLEANYPSCIKSTEIIANIIKDLVRSREYTNIYMQYFMIYIYYFMVSLMNVSFFIKNGVSVKNSASYAIDRKLKRFIDNLVS